MCVDMWNTFTSDESWKLNRIFLRKNVTQSKRVAFELCMRHNLKNIQGWSAAIDKEAFFSFDNFRHSTIKTKGKHTTAMANQNICRRNLNLIRGFCFYSLPRYRHSSSYKVNFLITIFGTLLIRRWKLLLKLLWIDN